MVIGKKGNLRQSEWFDGENNRLEADVEQNSSGGWERVYLCSFSSLEST
jgi:hypothetical protein